MKRRVYKRLRWSLAILALALALLLVIPSTALGRVAIRSSERGTKAAMVPGLYVLPITDDIILDNAEIDGAYLTDQITIGGVKGQDIPVRLVFQTAGAVTNLTATASDLTGDGNTILASNIEIKHLQSWMQFPVKYHPVAGSATLTPELLLNDDALVRVNGGDNQAYVSSSWVNLHGETTLAEEISIGETDWTVAAGSQFPTSYPYYLSCENEIVRVTNRVTNVLTVVRGEEGSSDTTHANGLRVTRNYPYPSMYLATADFPIEDAASLHAINVGASNGTQFWVTVHVPSDAVIGTYTGTISLDADGGNKGTYDITLTVYHFTLQSYPLVNNLYYDGQLSGAVPDGEIGRRYKSVTQMTAEYQDMYDHGVNYPMVAQSWDTPSLFNQVLDIIVNIGFPRDKIFLLGEEDNLGYGSTATAEELTAITDEVEDVIALVRAKGFYGDVYFYGIDEAGAATITAELDEWEAIHDGGGKVFVAGRYANAVAAGASGVLDVLNDSTETGWAGIATGWHAGGGLVNQYSNPQGGFETPLSYRLYAGLLLWQADLDGLMDWHYQGHYGVIWNEYSGGFGYNSTNIHPYAMTYPTVDGVVDTIEWEGWREGVLDLRYVTTLEDAIASSEEDTAAAEAYLAALRASDLTTQNLDTVRSDVVGFINDLTPSSKPSVSTYSVLSGSVTSVSATLRGEVTSTGGENCTAIGFKYGTVAGALDHDVSQGGDYGAVTFNTTVSGLGSGTVYYFRAYATNPSGTTFGDVLSFTTLAGTTPPATTTSAPPISTGTQSPVVPASLGSILVKGLAPLAVIFTGIMLTFKMWRNPLDLLFLFIGLMIMLIIVSYMVSVIF